MAFWNEPLEGTYLFLLPKDIRNLIKPLAPVHTYMWADTLTGSHVLQIRYIFCPLCYEMNRDILFDRACPHCNYEFPPIQTFEHFFNFTRIEKYSPLIAKRIKKYNIYRVIFGDE